MKKTRYLGYFQLSMAMFLAGSSVVVGKYISHLPIFLAQTISMIIALIVIIPMAVAKEGKFKLTEFKKKDLLFMILQGFFGVFMFRIFLLLALRYTTAASTGLILSTMPAVLAILSFLFLKKAISKKSILGIIFCVIGIAMINVNFKDITMKLSFNIILGNIFIFFSVVSEALFTVFRKKHSYSDKPLTSTAIVMFFALIMFLPIGCFQYASFSLSAFDIKDIISLIYYGVACSAIAYTFWFCGLAKVKINEAAGFTGVMPVSSLLLAMIFLKEQITINHVIGMITILLGIYMIIFKTKNQN